MSDVILPQAVKVVDDAKRWPAGDATKYLFQRYRTSSPDFRDALVLALIGEVIATEARRRSPAPEQTEAA